MATKRKGRTKTEISSSYEDVSSAHGNNDLTEKEAAQKAAREASLREMVANLSPDKTLQKVGAAQIEATKTFSMAQEALSNIIEEVRTTHEALELKRAELEELHGKDVIASATDVLIEEHQKKKAQLEQEALDLRNKFTKERQELQTADQEFKTQLTKQRAQEQQEFAYKTAKDRKEDADQFAEQVRARTLAERDRQETLSRQWAEREAALKLREQELIDLKAKVDAFPVQLDSEVKKQVAIVSNSMSRDHKHELELLKRDTASAAQLSNAQLTAKSDEIAKLQHHVQSLQENLNLATKQITDTASKALDGASGRQALAELQSVLSSQSANGPARKS